MTLINVKHLEKLGMVHGSPNRICTECLQRLDPAGFEKITRQLETIGEKA